MLDLIIIGAGSVGGHIATNLQDYSSDYNLLGFLDDDSSKNGISFAGFPVMGIVDEITKYSFDINIVVGIAFPSIKLQIIGKLKSLGFNNFPFLVSSSAWVSNNVQIGSGSIIYPGTTINYNTTIGNFVVLNMNCAIGHDCEINDYTSLAPGVLIGGNTTVDESTELGIGSRTLQGVSIGKNSSIGAGAVIIRNVPDGAVVVGNPGEIIKYYEL